MYSVRLWSVGHARGLNRLYAGFERVLIRLAARSRLEAARADCALEQGDVLPSTAQHAIETIKPLYPEQRILHAISLMDRL